MLSTGEARVSCAPAALGWFSLRKAERHHAFLWDSFYSRSQSRRSGAFEGSHTVFSLVQQHLAPNWDSQNGLGLGINL